MYTQAYVIHTCAYIQKENKREKREKKEKAKITGISYFQRSKSRKRRRQCGRQREENGEIRKRIKRPQVPETLKKHTPRKGGHLHGIL